MEPISWNGTTKYAEEAMIEFKLGGRWTRSEFERFKEFRGKWVVRSGVHGSNQSDGSFFVDTVVVYFKHDLFSKTANNDEVVAAIQGEIEPLVQEFRAAREAENRAREEAIRADERAKEMAAAAARAERLEREAAAAKAAAESERTRPEREAKAKAEEEARLKEWERTRPEREAKAEAEKEAQRKRKEEEDAERARQQAVKRRIDDFRSRQQAPRAQASIATPTLPSLPPTSSVDGKPASLGHRPAIGLIVIAIIAAALLISFAIWKAVSGS